MLYLLDTCSYLRLALSIHPLLGDEFYATPEAAKVTSEVNTEWEKQPKLQTKFHWAGQNQYVQNRTENLALLTGKQPTEIFKTRQFIHSYSQSEAKSIKKNLFTIPSPTDCAVLAYTLVLDGSGTKTTTVSDDGGMGFIASQLEIPYITTVDLVHKMYTADKRSLDQVKALAGYLDYEQDLPYNWKTQGPTLFGISLP